MTKAPFRLALAPLAIAAALITTPAHAGGVKAGTLIENPASATYDGGAGPVTIPSNTITVKVDELLDVTVTIAPGLDDFLNELKPGDPTEAD